MTLKLIFLFPLLLVSQISFTQTNKRTLLRDNHIKRIIVSKTDSVGGEKYVCTVSFVNDSGLVYKSICLDKQLDTIETFLYRYNELNRETEYKIIPKQDTGIIYKYNYEYFKDGITTTHQNSNKTTTRNIIKRKKKKDIIYHYRDDTLVQISTWKYSEKINIGHIQYISGNRTRKRTLKLREYKDSKGNITKRSTTSYNKIRASRKVYTVTISNGKIIKDTSKYKTYKYKHTASVTNEYNETGLLIKTIYHPSLGYARPGFQHAPQRYSCVFYEYLSK